jgi:FK506-binding nuclear protein
LESMDEDEEDELDGMDDPRVTEVESEDEIAPKLVAAGKKADKKGDKKRKLLSTI